MLLSGKKGLIIGVANKHSIAWAIAQSAAGQGAQLMFNYQNERLRENVEELVATMPGAKSFPCDVGDDAQIAALMQHVQQEVGTLDFLVHSVAFAPREELTGQFVNTSRQGFAMALDVSAYSLVAVTKMAVPLMTAGGSVVTLTYLGAERVVPHYNVMGVAKAALEASVRYLAYDLGPKNIRVNAISAGPIKTLAARGLRHQQNGGSPPRVRTSPSRNGTGRSWRHGVIFGQCSGAWNYRRSDLRRRRVSYSGIVGAGRMR